MPVTDWLMCKITFIIISNNIIIIILILDQKQHSLGILSENKGVAFKIKAKINEIKKKIF